MVIVSMPAALLCLVSRWGVEVVRGSCILPVVLDGRWRPENPVRGGYLIMYVEWAEGAVRRLDRETGV